MTDRRVSAAPLGGTACTACTACTAHWLLFRRQIRPEKVLISRKVNDWSTELTAPKLCGPAVHTDVNLLVAHDAAQFGQYSANCLLIWGSNILKNLNVLKSRVRFEVLEKVPDVM